MMSSKQAEPQSNVVPLRQQMPAPPIGQRFSETAYEDPPRWLKIAVCGLSAALIVAALYMLPPAGQPEHGQRTPTGLGGTDRAEIPSAARQSPDQHHQVRP
jgi:hypothetical protein